MIGHARSNLPASIIGLVFVLGMLFWPDGAFAQCKLTVGTSEYAGNHTKTGNCSTPIQVSGSSGQGSCGNAAFGEVTGTAAASLNSLTSTATNSNPSNPDCIGGGGAQLVATNGVLIARSPNIILTCTAAASGDDQSNCSASVSGSVTGEVSVGCNASVCDSPMTTTVTVPTGTPLNLTLAAETSAGGGYTHGIANGIIPNQSGGSSSASATISADLSLSSLTRGGCPPPPVSTTCGNDPVSLPTGNVFHEERDYTTAGKNPLRG